MDNLRRKTLKSGGGVALLSAAAVIGLVPGNDALAQAWNKTAFEGNRSMMS
jgi:hypothetical protein